MAGERPTLERRPGILSGRLVPTEWAAPEGTHVFVLGSQEPGHVGRMQSNETVRVTQSATVPDDSVAVAQVRLHKPSEAANGGLWAFSARNGNGAQFFLGVFGFPWPAGVTIDMDDLAVQIDAGGTDTVAYELGVSSVVDPQIDTEIPVVMIDGITIAPLPDGVGFFNRLPANGMIGAPRTTPIIFYVITNTPVANYDSLVVYVNGALVMTGEVFEPGFTGGSFPINTRTGAFFIQPDVPFDSEEVVTVRALFSYESTTIDRTWSFTVVDETAPRLLTASASAHDRIRVVWDEDVRMVDVSASNDALNPANWTVAPVTPMPITRPAVSVSVVGVVAISSREVELILDIPMTQAADYVITASNVEDLIGNEVAPPNDTITIQGFTCTSFETRRFSLWWMLSDMDRRRDTTHDLEKFLSVLQEPLDQLLCDIDRWTDILDVDTAAERYLDQMLITLGNPFTFELSVIDKRRLIRSLVRMYQQKGTAVGIINVVRFFLGIEITISNYNQDGWLLGIDELGWDTFLASSESFAKYSFVITSPVILTDEQRKWIRALAVYMKPAHTHLIEIIEPEVPEVIDHLELGFSELGSEEAPWMLH